MRASNRAQIALRDALGGVAEIGRQFGLFIAGADAVLDGGQQRCEQRVAIGVYFFDRLIEIASGRQFDDGDGVRSVLRFDLVEGLTSVRSRSVTPV